MKLNIRKFSILVVAFLFSLTYYQLSAQSESDAKWYLRGENTNTNFYDVQNDFYKYWDGKVIRRGSGYKVFKRWEAYMAPRVYPSGQLNLPSQNYTNLKTWEKENRGSNTSNLRAANWVELGPIGSPSGPFPYTRTGAGRTTFLQFDPNNTNIMYVGTPDGGLWTSTDGGSSYQTNSDYLTVIGCSGLAIDPGNSKIIYLATGDIGGDKNSIGILKTIDGGVTWNATGASWPINYYWTISKLIMNPSDPLNMLVSTNVGIFRTTDGWVTSTQVQNTTGFKDIEFKPGSPNTIYAAGTELWKSIDNGVNWSQITSGIPTSNVSRIALAVTPANSDFVYAIIGKANDQSMFGVYRSVDSGSNFSTQVDSTSINLLGYEANGLDFGSGQAFHDLAIVVSPSNADIVTVGGVNHWQSTDGGANWANTSVWDSGEAHADVHELTYQPGSSTIMYSCNDGGLFKSTDNGNQWVDISGNLAISQVVKLGLSADVETTIVVGEQDNGTNLKTGSSWNNIFGGDGGDCFIDYTNNNTIYIQYVNGDFHRSDDGGATTVSIKAGLPMGFDFYSPWKMDPVDNMKIYVGGIPTLYVSNDQGTNWAAIGTPPGSGTITDFAIAPSNTDYIYALKIDNISLSTDGGTTFNSINGTLPTGSASLSSVTVSNTNPDNAWVTFSGYSVGEKVYKTTDAGVTWTNVSAGLPNLPINTLVYLKDSPVDAVYIGADIGIYYQDNTDNSWVPYFNNLPNCSVRDLEIFYPTNKLRAGTYGRGVWESKLYNPNVHCSTVVSNTNDDGLGSLRRAIECVSDGGTVTFDPILTDGIGNDTILLTSGPIKISKNINILQTASTIPKIKTVGGTGPIFKVEGAKTLTLKYLDLYAGTNLNNRALQNNGTLVLENINIYEKAGIAGTGSTFTNMGNVIIINNVQVIVDP